MTLRRTVLVALAVAASSVCNAAAGQTADPAAAGAPDPVALLERSIEHHGGREALSDLPDLEMRGGFESGRWSSGRQWDIVRYERGDGAFRTEVTFEMRGSKVTPVEYFDGDRQHKRRFRTGWDDLPLDEPREMAAHRLSFLLTALERNPRLVGEGEVDGVPAWRIAVEDGGGEAIVSLARDDARLVALEYPAVDAEGMGTKEKVTRHLAFRDYRPVNGLLLPYDVEVRSDGTLKYRVRYEKIAVLDYFDPEWITVPDPSRRFIPGEELAY